MIIRFEAVMLDSVDDRGAVLVFRDNRLTAVASRLDALHEEFEGHWFVEAMLDGEATLRPPPFATLGELEAWAGRPRSPSY